MKAVLYCHSCFYYSRQLIWWCILIKTLMLSRVWSRRLTMEDQTGIKSLSKFDKKTPRKSISWTYEHIACFWHKTFNLFFFICAYRTVVGTFLCGPATLARDLERKCVKYSDVDPRKTRFYFNKENFWAVVASNQLNQTDQYFSDSFPFQHEVIKGLNSCQHVEP